MRERDRNRGHSLHAVEQIVPTHPAIRNANHRQKYLKQLSLNGPFIIEG